MFKYFEPGHTFMRADSVHGSKIRCRKLRPLTHLRTSSSCVEKVPGLIDPFQYMLVTYTSWRTVILKGKMVTFPFWVMFATWNSQKEAVHSSTSRALSKNRTQTATSCVEGLSSKQLQQELKHNWEYRRRKRPEFSSWLHPFHLRS